MTADPIVLLQATNIPYMSNSAQVLAQELRQAGLNVKVEPWTGPASCSAAPTATRPTRAAGTSS